ncbi:hypothetical protein [Novosphingobium pentaromativorans]|nr:hypothetical protein [Novosphingobium pentaromativorans]AIT81903.1 hypothetical protein JI59_20235 [Novosphingobium pentaromativorans US6-1]
MASVIEAYRDEKGNLHHEASSAIIADIAAALGRVGDEGGLTEGVARLILEKRAAIEKAFGDLDRLEGNSLTVIDVSDHLRVQSLSA